MWSTIELNTLGIAAAVTLVFTGLAYSVRGVTRSGAIAGALVCLVLYACAGWGALAALATVFLLAWTTTRIGYARKREIGVAKVHEGRSASQVLANLGVAAASAAIYAATRNIAFLVAVGAALAEAAADTVSSELGQAQSEKARLITTWQSVPAGTDGGITLRGTIAGIVAAIIVSTVYLASGEVSWKLTFVMVFAAILGLFADSFLGALWERRGYLNNDSVNFLSNFLAAGFAFAFSYLHF
ncbi:MAG: TIGR00297 family protein [Terriglobales bacterium]